MIAQIVMGAHHTKANISYAPMPTYKTIHPNIQRHKIHIQRTQVEVVF
jgi:hypothetical protein